ncbi:unnamed protein product [Oppiella nova]|uniref:Ig-like domain-containing protein n=1 Tax=Oppiella nova TaxID=334625 RepID=A0A7R9QBZ8_9ACAR|nr:unnamed protein product [Oppiella nova]CAG2162840.1 unnamed protein product [Oppiella nova]
MGRPLHDTIGPYDEDSNLRLLCEAEGGKPPPSLLWYREDQMMDDSYSHSADNKTIRNDILIINLTRHDLNTKYSCQASNPNFTAPIQTSVRLDINLKPLDIRLNSLEGQLSAGNSVELVCNTAGSRPPAQVSWFRDSRPLSHSSERTQTIGNLTTSAITYTPTADDHGAYLSCRAENLRLANSTIEIGYKLNVFCFPYIPPPNPPPPSFRVISEALVASRVVSAHAFDHKT